MESLPIQRQQFLATAFRQRFERYPKSGNAGEDRHFVGRTVRLLGKVPTRLHKLFAIQGDVLQVFLHQHLRIKPAHLIPLDYSPYYPTIPLSPDLVHRRVTASLGIG
jgi:hypothetical protein